MNIRRFVTSAFTSVRLLSSFGDILSPDKSRTDVNEPLEAQTDCMRADVITSLGWFDSDIWLTWCTFCLLWITHQRNFGEHNRYVLVADYKQLVLYCYPLLIIQQTHSFSQTSRPDASNNQLACGKKWGLNSWRASWPQKVGARALKPLRSLRLWAF